MKYMKVDWIHSFKDEPVKIYGELNETMDEQRKIEVFLDGSYGYAVLDGAEHRSFVSEAKWATKEEIEKDSQFQVSCISKKEFEEVWIKAVDTSK